MAVAQAREGRWDPVLGLVGSQFDNGTGKQVEIINVNQWPIGLDLRWADYPTSGAAAFCMRGMSRAADLVS